MCWQVQPSSIRLSEGFVHVDTCALADLIEGHSISHCFNINLQVGRICVPLTWVLKCYLRCVTLAKLLFLFRTSFLPPSLCCFGISLRNA